ncbi:putative alcohol dehydrogenase [Xylaria flabelliformis]|nr:putative alcohol dehydrogenase [Xylaria flabelliformis]
MSRTQKALIVSELGKPVTLASDWPIPEPGPNQVQVKVTVAGLNPHDQKARDWGLFIADNLPAILTNDVVGKVTKLGQGVTDIAIGDRIVYQAGFTLNAASSPGSTQSGLQEYAIADTVSLAKIPDSITDDEAATLPCNVIAPVVALFHSLQIPAPWSQAAKEFDSAAASILIIGGGSNCGRFGVQLAKMAGIGRIVVVGGNEVELKSFGATHVIDRHAGQDVILARIRDIVGDDLVYALDAINPLEGQVLALNALSSHKKGAMARLIPHGAVDESKVLGKKAGFDVRDVFGVSQASPELTADFWSRVPEYLSTGQIKPLAYTVKKGLLASNVNEVLDAYKDGKAVTKTHIHVV